MFNTIFFSALFVLYKPIDIACMFRLGKMVSSIYWNREESSQKNVEYRYKKAQVRKFWVQHKSYRRKKGLCYTSSTCVDARQVWYITSQVRTTTSPPCLYFYIYSKLSLGGKRVFIHSVLFIFSPFSMNGAIKQTPFHQQHLYHSPLRQPLAFRKNLKKGLGKGAENCKVSVENVQR